jgi:hypothetical protein
MTTWLKDTIERAVATAAECALSVIGVDAVVDATAVDWKAIAGIAAGGAILSVLKSVAARGFNDSDTASLVDLAPAEPT